MTAMAIDMLESINSLDEISGTPTEDAVKRLADQVGLNHGDIRIQDVALNWANNCLIATLHIGRARFERALTPPDLGLDDNGELQDYIRTIYPGKQLLVTGEYRKLIQKLNALEQKARRVVDRYSLKTVFGPAVSCVRKGKMSPFEKMCRELDDVKLRYRAAYEEVIDKLDEIRSATEDIFWNSSNYIYGKLYNTAAVATYEFQKSFVSKAMANFPSIHQVEASYRFELVPTFVPLSGANQEMELLQHSALQLKREVVDSIRNSYREQVQTFVEDILADLRQTVYETVALALDTLRKNGSLPGPTIQSLRTMIAQIEDLNFADDREVMAQVNRLRESIQTDETRDMESIGSILEELKEENRKFLLSLGRKPRAVRSRAEKKSPINKNTSVQRKRRNVGGVAVIEKGVPVLPNGTITLIRQSRTV